MACGGTDKLVASLSLYISISGNIILLKRSGVCQQHAHPRYIDVQEIEVAWDFRLHTNELGGFEIEKHSIQDTRPSPLLTSHSTLNMFSKITFVTSLLLSHWTTKSVAVCDYYSPAFPLPQLSPDDQLVKSARNTIKLALDEAITQGGFDTSSYSIEVTSSTETLFELHHTAADKDAQRPGAETVDGSSCYRIASITKSFTVLAILQQQIAGRLDLDDPVNLYIPELGEKSAGGIPWKDISIRTLASQLSGIPRDSMLHL